MKNLLFLKRIFLISIFSFLLINLHSQNQEQINDIMDIYKITSTFGDSRGDHFHTGIDLAAINQDIRSISNGEVIFFNKNRLGNIPYGNGNFIIIEDKVENIRVSYSHLQDKSINTNKITYRIGEKVAVVGNSGHSTGYHLHLELEDTKNNRLLNPIAFINQKYTEPPIIQDIYFITNENEKISMIKGSSLKKGGRLFISAVDKLNNSTYLVTPYKIKVMIDGKDKSELIFDSMKKTESSYIIESCNMVFEEIYVNKIDFDFYLCEIYSIPNTIGLRIFVENYSGLKTEFRKAIRIL